MNSSVGRLATGFGLSALLAVAAAPSIAAPGDPGLSVGASAIFADYEEDRGTTLSDSSTGLRLFGTYRFNKWFGLEGAYTKFGEFEETQPGTGEINVDLDGVSALGLVYIPVGSEDVEFFGKAGWFDFDQQFEAPPPTPIQSNSPDGATVGLGMLVYVTDALQFRGDLDWYDVDQADLWALNVGVQYLFGGRAKPAPVAAAAPPPPAAPAAPVDSDGDGVPDSADKCPGTPAGAKVDANGCELDSDGDGVVDRLDECPGTPAGAKVDARGCEEEIVLRGVNFETNSAVLLSNATATLDQAADVLKNRPNVKVEVQGHTDDRGADAYNLGLSDRRANTVRDYLIDKGVSADVLTAVGYGESQPVAGNDTAEGRAENRRVTLKFAK